MSDLADRDFSDVFTDGSVRYSQDGITRLSKQNWIASLSIQNKIATIRLYYDNVPIDVGSLRPFRLDTTNTLLRAVGNPNTTIASVPATSWVSAGATGVYTVDLTGSSWATVTRYTVEVVLATTYTNPAVSGKTSKVTGLPATYTAETLRASWVAESAPEVNSQPVAKTPSGEYLQRI